MNEEQIVGFENTRNSFAKEHRHLNTYQETRVMVFG